MHLFLIAPHAIQIRVNGCFSSPLAGEGWGEGEKRLHQPLWQACPPTARQARATQSFHRHPTGTFLRTPHDHQLAFRGRQGSSSSARRRRCSAGRSPQRKALSPPPKAAPTPWPAASTSSPTTYARSVAGLCRRRDDDQPLLPRQPGLPLAMVDIGAPFVALHCRSRSFFLTEGLPC